MELEADNLNRGKLIRSALGLEWLTVGWMVIEAAVAIGAAVQANSLTLLAFDIDSLIELISACVLLWRLKVELAEGAEFSEKTERVASRIGAVLLGLLVLYVVGGAAWVKYGAEGPRREQGL